MLDAENLILPLMLLFAIVVLIILLCAGIVIYTKKAMEKLTIKMNNEYISYKNELKEQNDALVKQLFKQLSEQDSASGGITKNNESGKNLMNVFVKLRESIKESCISTMNEIGAARIAIYLFHNGTHSTHGINFIKMSCICEKVAIGSGIRERMVDHTNIPINLFDDMIDKLITYDRYIIMNNEDLQETNHKMFISADKINYTQLVTIYDINNNMLGFVAVEMDRPYSKDDADREKEILDELVKQLVPVLSYSDYIKLKLNS